jgi:flagellar basal-body rod protein FlgB
MTDIFQHFQTLQHAIEYAHQSHQATGQNIANLNTPGYKAIEVPFEQLIQKIDSNQSANSHYNVSQVSGLTQRMDGNNVDVDYEIAQMKKNALAHQTLTQLLGSKMGILKQSING